MVLRSLNVLTLIACFAVGGATPAPACCWLFGGGGYGAFRPLSWGSYYRGGWGGSGCCSPYGYSAGYSSYGYSDYGSGCCGSGSCGTGSCGTGGCGTGGCCGTSNYGPACDSCGVGCSSGCCGTANYGVSSNCCSPYAPATSDPVPDSTINRGTVPGTDNFERSRGGAGTTPPSSIPATPGTGTNPAIDWSNPAATPEYGSDRGTRDYLDNSGGDAIPFTPPRSTPAPGDPVDPIPNEKVIQREIQPLDVDGPVQFAFRPHRERIDVRSTSHRLPQVAAKSLPAVNDGWEPVRVEGQVASR